MGNKFFAHVVAVAAVGLVSRAQAQTALISVAVDDRYTVAQGLKLDVPANLGLKSNDTNASGLSVALKSSPLHGVVTVASDGGFVYQPSSDFEGLDGFQYNLVDSSGRIVATAGVEVKVQKNLIAKIDIDKPQALAGQSVAVTLVMSEPAQSGGLELPVSYVNCSGPASVRVGSGQMAMPFAVTADVGTQDVVASIIVNPGSRQASKTFKVVAPRVVGLNMDKATVPGGTALTGKVSVADPAPAGGLWVGLATSIPVPSATPFAYIPKGKTSGSFSIPTQPVATDTTGWIETRGYGACRASVSVRSPRLTQISLPSSVYVDQALTGSFTLDSPAPPTGTVITLSGLGITNLQSDVVLPGETTGRFTGTAADVPMVQVTGSLLDSTFTSSSLVIRAGVSAIDVPSSAAGNSTFSGKVTLNWRSGPKGTVVALTGAGLVGLPPSVTVPPGGKSASFTFSTPSLMFATNYVVLAQAGGTSKSATINVLADVKLASVSVPSAVAGGASVTGTVSLNTKAAAGGFPVNLSAPGLTGVPATVVVPSGQSSATFTFTSPSLSDATPFTVTAQAGGVSASSTFTVQSAVQLVSLTLPATVYAGNSLTGTISLSMKSGVNGSTISLSSPTLTGLPSSVAVLAGQQTASFKLNAPSVLAATTYAVNASLGGVAKSATVQVLPIQLATLTLPANVYGGSTVTGTVSLNAAAGASGYSVSLSGGNLSGLASAVTVPAGQQSANFTFVAPDTSTSTISLVIATGGSVSKYATVTVVPKLTLTNLTVNNSSPKSGDTVTFTVQLSAAASAGPVTVTLSSSNAALVVPSTITVPQGASSVTFTSTVGTLTKDASASVSATLGSSSKNCSLNLKKP